MNIRPLYKYASAFLLAAAPCLILSTQPANSTAQSSNLPTVAAASDCSALTSADVSKAVGASTIIKTATVVNDGKTAAYCKLEVVVDDFAKIEIHLPVSAWTQRLLFGGGQGAQVPSSGMKLDQFVTVSWQDLNNRGREDVYATNAQARVNGAYRGMHLQVLATKALIAKYYGQAQKFAYYNGCSEPGREGMMEVQRFPEDFDGVAAGCPPINDTINNGMFYAWNIRANTGADGKSIITQDKLPMLHQAVLDECDSADGVKDGIISDPLNCHPKLTAVECKPGQDASSCLTPAQVHAAQELYRGAHDDQGNKLAPIGVLPGSELFWYGVIIPRPVDPSRGPQYNDVDGTTYAVRSQFNYPSLPITWKLSDLVFNRASFAGITSTHFLFDATDPDLSAFQKAGHKLILWQGLSDTAVLPAHTILYYTALQKQLGKSTVDGFVRFYILPGVGHCGGGDGPSIKDFLTPLMAWVEHGIAPGPLPATHIPQAPRGAAPAPAAPGAPPAAVDLTRPVYPYPYTQKYVGTGDVRDPASFTQGPANPAPASLFTWLGADFYTPHYEKWCTGDGAVLSCKDSR